MSTPKLPWQTGGPPQPAAPSTPSGPVPEAGVPAPGMPVAVPLNSGGYPAPYPTGYQAGYPAAQPAPYPSPYPAAQPVPYPSPYPAAQPVAPSPYPYPSALPMPATPVAPGNAATYASPRPVMPAAPQPAYPPQPSYPPQPAYGQPAIAQPVYPAAPASPTQPAAYAPAQPYAQPVPVSAPVPMPVQPSVQPVVRPATPVPVPSAPRPVPVGASGPRPVAVSGPGAPVIAIEEEEEETIEERLVHESPAFLISAIINASIIVLLAIFGIYGLPKKALEIEAVIWAEDIGVQLEEEQLTTGLMENVEVEEPVLSKDLLAVNDPFAAPPEMEVALDGFNSTSTIEAPSIGMALSGREKGMKEALLGKYGGTASTEAAVRLGLEWLKRNQEASGLWSLTGPYANGAGLENRCAATAMALLAFQGAGHTHKEGDFKKEVAKGWAALIKTQDKDGLFYHEGVHHQMLYAQGQATIAICELYGMTKDKDFKQAAQRAVDYAVKIQAPEGGWRYTPGQDSDTSVTGWYVMALQSAMMAGLEVPSPTLEKISKFLDTVATDDGSRYGYRPNTGSTETMTAEGLLCRQYLSWKHDDPRLAKGVQFLLDNPIRWDFDNQNVYYWYYATQVTHHMEGEAWKEWNNVMRQVIPKNQTKTGKEAGSWAPENDRWGAHGGRLYETCLCIYMLEVYYRHLPIYKWRQQ